MGTPQVTWLPPSAPEEMPHVICLCHRAQLAIFFYQGITGQIIVFHLHPDFPEIFGDFPYFHHHLGWVFSCFRSRANLTRRYQVEPFRPFQGPRMLASSPPVDDVKINFQPKKNTFICHQNASLGTLRVKSKVCWNNGMFHGNEPNVGRYALKCLGMLKIIPSWVLRVHLPMPFFRHFWVNEFPFSLLVGDGQDSRKEGTGYFCDKASFLIKPSEYLATGWWFFTNPFEKYAQVKLGENLPQLGVKITNIRNHHLDNYCMSWWKYRYFPSPNHLILHATLLILHGASCYTTTTYIWKSACYVFSKQRSKGREILHRTCVRKCLGTWSNMMQKPLHFDISLLII